MNRTENSRNRKLQMGYDYELQWREMENSSCFWYGVRKKKSEQLTFTFISPKKVNIWKQKDIESAVQKKKKTFHRFPPQDKKCEAF